MPITVKGNFSVGDNVPQQKKNEAPKSVSSFAEIKTTEVAKHRTVPVRTYETIDGEVYERVEEAELIKHYNKRSSYLSDMIQSEEIK